MCGLIQNHNIIKRNVYLGLRCLGECLVNAITLNENQIVVIEQLVCQNEELVC